MKCPYQTKVIHKPEYTEGCVDHFAEDITNFCECIKSECPFYYMTDYYESDYKPTKQIAEHCRRAESEYKE